VREPVVTDPCPSLADLVLADDGGLSPSHQAEMTAHLATCEACRKRLQQANAFMEASAELDDNLASGDAAADAREMDAVWLVADRGRARRPASVNLASEGLASESLAGESLMNRRGVSDRVGNARAAMPVSFEDEIGAEFDSAEKDAARNREFARRLHKQKQDVIHRPAPTTAWVRRWLPAAAVIPLLIFGLALPRWQAVVRAEELLDRASTHESSLPVDRVQRLRIRLTPGIPAFAPQPGGRRAAVPSVAPFLAVRDVTGAAARSVSSGGVASRGALSDDPSADDAGTTGTSGTSGTSGEFAAVERMLAHHGFEWRQPLSLAAVRAWRSSPIEKHDEVFVSSDGMLVLKTTATEGTLREVELTVRRDDYHVVKLSLAFEGIGRLEITEIEESVRAVKAAPMTPPAPLAASPAPLTMTTVPSPAAARDIAADAALSPVTTVVGRAPVTQPGLSRWLDRTFGVRPERTTFVPDLQRLVIGVRQNLSALDTLARRYPEEEVEQQWSGADRAALRRRVDESYRRISRDLNDLDARVGILFGSTTRSLPVAEAPADWRQRAAAALAHAEAMDVQVRQLLTFDDVPSRGGSRVTGGALVPSTFAALWDVVHAPVGGPASR
jgi:Putative zinc-finger